MSPYFYSFYRKKNSAIGQTQHLRVYLIPDADLHQCRHQSCFCSGLTIRGKSLDKILEYFSHVAPMNDVKTPLPVSSIVPTKMFKVRKMLYIFHNFNIFGCIKLSPPSILRALFHISDCHYFDCKHFQMSCGHSCMMMVTLELFKTPSNVLLIEYWNDYFNTRY